MPVLRSNKRVPARSNMVPYTCKGRKMSSTSTKPLYQTTNESKDVPVDEIDNLVLSMNKLTLTESQTENDKTSISSSQKENDSSGFIDEDEPIIAHGPNGYSSLIDNIDTESISDSSDSLNDSSFSIHPPTDLGSFYSDEE